MLYALIALLIIVIIYLVYKLNKKVVLDTNIAAKNEQAAQKLVVLQNQYDDLIEDIHAQQDVIDNYNDKIIAVKNQYEKELQTKTQYLDDYYNKLKASQEENYQNALKDFQKNYSESADLIEQSYQDLVKDYEKQHTDNEAILAAEQEKINSLILSLEKMEKDKQARVYYTIQIPDEYKDDIQFLLTEVSPKIEHPDIVNKLVWTEYIKPRISETFTRIKVEENPGIYKLTNIDNNKCYIGKSTNVKKRITDHFKSVIGISTISDQLVHHEILKTGLWNWTIEVITYCDKDKLSELEQYYINVFKAQEWGFNKTKGG